METQGRIVPAAGMFKTVEDVQRALELPISEIYLGSITLPAKKGNPGKTFDTDGSGNYWNAIGLLNGGAEYYAQALPEIYSMVQNAGRRLVVSVSGETAEENAKLAALARQYCDDLELNSACPNVVIDGGGRKPLIGFSATTLLSHLSAVHAVTKKGLRVKLPPYTDLEAISDVARMISENPHLVDAVVATNTLPGCMPYDESGIQRISVGIAGGSGEQLHTLAVGNAKRWRDLLPDIIDVYGAGGAHSAQNIRNFERVGVKGCQMGGAFYHEGARALQHVLMSL